MKVFAGSPIHLMEFENDNININITTHSWSFLGQSGFSVILNKDSLTMYNGLVEDTVVSFERRMINIEDKSRIMFMLQQEGFKFENYFYAKIQKSDLIVLRVDLLNKSSYDYLLNIILSNMFLVKIPVLFFKVYNDSHEISYFYPDKKDYVIFKGSPYAYFNVVEKNEHVIMLHGKYRDKVKNKLVSFLKKVGDFK
ncbi:hypothetical protein LN42_06640 [Marinitoga sp. 1137]|uniref:hypothetical protein n=1 Tax=Marinitoga sp. 1137 TaxID=1545835 RepID=UPI000950459A|nr:hypothetical protein [Marinitoga sp. 1137]APT76093.1 hypothetical protein LN42_06640 [Marinitoga sp. 1137]